MNCYHIKHVFSNHFSSGFFHSNEPSFLKKTFAWRKPIDANSTLETQLVNPGSNKVLMLLKKFEASITQA